MKYFYKISGFRVKNFVFGIFLCLLNIDFLNCFKNFIFVFYKKFGVVIVWVVNIGVRLFEIIVCKYNLMVVIDDFLKGSYVRGFYNYNEVIGLEWKVFYIDSVVFI